MKVEDKCLVSLTMPPGTIIVIISRGTNKESEANNESVRYTLSTDIVILNINI